MTEDEEEEIGQVFALMCDYVDDQDKEMRLYLLRFLKKAVKKWEEFMDEIIENEVLQMFSCGCVDKIKVELRTNKNQQDERFRLAANREIL